MNKEPLTPEDYQKASNQFFPLFDIVHRNMVKVLKQKIF